MPNHTLVIEHLMKHQTYPATKDEIVGSFSEMHGVESEETRWLESTLPDAYYDSADEVKEELQL